MSLPRTCRRSPIAAALLLTSCVSLVYFGLTLLLQAHLPSDGVLLSELRPAGVCVTRRIEATPGGLQSGDRLLAIDGVSIWEWVEQALQGGPGPGWQVGRQVTYRLQRDSETIDVLVTLAPFPLPNLMLRRAGPHLVMLVGLGVSTYIFLARPRDAAARILFLGVISLIFAYAFSFQTAVLVTPALFQAKTLIDFLFQSLAFSAALHFSLMFPTIRPALRQHSRWLYGLHLVNPALSIVAGLILGHTAAERVSVALVTRYWIGLLMLAIAMVNVVYASITARQSAERSQVRWVAWGAVVGLLPFMLLTALPELVRGEAIVAPEITTIFGAVLPFSVAVAIARHRLFDIDRLIHRSLLYGLLTLLMGGLYLLLVTVIGAIVIRFTGRASNSTVVFVATLIVVTAFWIARRRVGRIIDRVFYRNPIDPDVLLRDGSALLGNVIRLEEITALLTEVLPQHVSASSGALLIPVDEEGGPADRGAEMQRCVSEILVQWQQYGSASVLLSMPPTWLPPFALERLTGEGFVLLLPLTAGGQIVGLWALGPRLSGRAYTTDEITALGTLARQAAVALENARLISRLERYSQQLEEEVQGRTQDLENERNRLNVILQNIADGLLVISPGGRILLINPAFEEMVRSPARVLLGRQLDEVLAFPDIVEITDRALAQEGQVQVGDLVLQERVFKGSALALRDHSGVVTVLHDVTREREVDRMKSEFVSTVSHELRTPLTSVLGFAKLIRKSLDRHIAPRVAADDERAQTALRRIRANADIIISEGSRLTRLINDVLDIAKMEEGKLEWFDQPIDLPRLIEEVSKEMQGLAREKGLLLEAQVENAALFPPVVADPDRLRQVLINLLANAIKFTDSGRVIVAARLLSGQDSPNTPEFVQSVRVSVTDTGRGIPEEEMPRLFQRFQQIGNTLRDRPTGTGLGLAICREIVTHYGGEIWAESSPGLGATFYFTLPVSNQEPTAQPAAPEEAA